MAHSAVHATTRKPTLEAALTTLTTTLTYDLDLQFDLDSTAVKTSIPNIKVKGHSVQKSISPHREKVNQIIVLVLAPNVKKFKNFGIHSVSAESSHATFGKLPVSAAVIRTFGGHQK